MKKHIVKIPCVKKRYDMDLKEMKLKAYCLRAVRFFRYDGHADQIILIDNGRIEEIGAHTSLMTLKGHYYSMIKEQEKAKEWMA